MPFVRVALTAMGVSMTAAVSVSWLAVTVLLTAMGVSMTAAVSVSMTAE